MGAIFYFMLTGKPPFCSNELKTLYEEILKGDIRNDEGVISEIAMDLIKVFDLGFILVFRN